MPDWITHIAVAWIIGTLLGLRYKQFNQSNTAIIMVGALIPDIIKISIITNYLGYNIYNYITPIHLPIGSIIIVGMITLLFKEKKWIFLFLLIGITTHYLLDLLLEGEGMTLFYPFYWGQWQLGLTTSQDYTSTIIALSAVILVYMISRYQNRIRG
jgi:hypothetical protein